MEVWHPKTASFEPLVDENEAAMIPIQDFERCASAVVEDEDISRHRISQEVCSNDGGEPVDGFAEILWLGGKEDSDRAWDGNHGCTRTEIRRATALASKPGCRWMQ